MKITLREPARTQKIPGSIIDDLREYAKALNFPDGWAQNITISHRNASGSAALAGWTIWDVDYKGQTFATYELDLSKEIQTRLHHMPSPPPADPLVVATELAIGQPADVQWRRFRHLVFQRAEVVFVNNVDKASRENGESFEIVFRNGTKLVCGNEKNYANSGMSTCEFFIEHVMQLQPEKR